MSDANAYLQESVIAVPPLARNGDLKIDVDQNRRLVDHLKRGGVRTLLYGGNANFYNIGMYEYAEVIETLGELKGDDIRVIPSAGPEYGRLLDQAPILRDSNFETVMVLPALVMSTPEGARRAILDFVDRIGKPIVLYLKSETYLGIADVAKLVRSSAVSWIKYAVVRSESSEDNFLRMILDNIDRDLVVSGMGELPAVTHLRDFGLTGFTSGSVCVAPALSMRLLSAAKESDWDCANHIRSEFQSLEALRNKYGPATVLHDAVTLSEIANCGPMLPLLSSETAHLAIIKNAARMLLARNAAEHESGTVSATSRWEL